MKQCEDGFIYLWALFAVALAGVIMAGTAQVWQIQSQREKEAELLYVGEQFRNAILSYYNSSPGNSKEYPKSLDDLLLDSRSPAVKRHLRKIYRDPITNSDEWGFAEEAAANTGSVASSNIAARITGVYSLSEKKPLKKDKFPEHYAKFTEALTYRDWQFVFNPSDAKKSQAPNAAQPAKPGQPGQPASPFAPQPSSATNNAASPFAAQPSSATQPKTPAFGSPPQ